MSDNQYDEKYEGEDYYWGVIPSNLSHDLLRLLPPERHLRLLEIGCGEGRDAVFFARNGYDVSAFDLSPQGVDKTMALAARAGVALNAFQADLLTWRLTEAFDALFANGVLHLLPPEMRREIFDNYKTFTKPGGLHVFSVFVEKPFIASAPDAEDNFQKWISGELFTHYHDWYIERCEETVFDCLSAGVPHQHAVNTIFARKPGQ
ncbi:MAG: class I SAM-dependent methyltransferase [bacterium]|nr:class I SAM-dependent methyltransferase [bacterium]